MNRFLVLSILTCFYGSVSNCCGANGISENCIEFSDSFKRNMQRYAVIRDVSSNNVSETNLDILSGIRVLTPSEINIRPAKSTPLPLADQDGFIMSSEHATPRLSHRVMGKSEISKKIEYSKPKKTESAKCSAISTGLKSQEKSSPRLSRVQTEIDGNIACLLYIRYNNNVSLLQRTLDDYKHNGDCAISIQPELAQNLVEYHINALTSFCCPSKVRGGIFYKEFDERRYEKSFRRFCKQIDICLPILVPRLGEETIKGLLKKVNQAPVLKAESSLIKERSDFLKDVSRTLSANLRNH